MSTSSKQTAVRLPAELYDRLRALSADTGRTATFYIRRAVEAYITDLEEIYRSERVLERIKSRQRAGL